VEIKEKILKISLKLFIERGFLEVYIKDLIREIGIEKSVFYHYFKSKDQLIFEVIEEFWSPHLNNIIRVTDEYNDSSEKKLLKIFQKYSEIESYLRNNLNLDGFNYSAIIFLTIEGLKRHEFETNKVVEFNNRLLEKIESIIEDGKRLGEILNNIDSKSIAINILSSLQSDMVLWAMNQDFNIKELFEMSFKYLWNSIKLPESNHIILDGNMINKCTSSPYD
jgi:AcrR family transcriptional regulator